MRWVVFLRAANVGKHNRFQPRTLAKDLSAFGAINLGAVGTFIIPKDMPESALHDGICAKLPIQCDVMLCRAPDIAAFVENAARSVRSLTDADVEAFVTVLAQRPAKLPPLPICAPNVERWQVKVVRVEGSLVLSLRRQVKSNTLYPNQLIERQFGCRATTRSWNTLLKVTELLNA